MPREARIGFRYRRAVASKVCAPCTTTWSPGLDAVHNRVIVADQIAEVHQFLAGDGRAGRLRRPRRKTVR